MVRSNSAPAANAMSLVRISVSHSEFSIELKTTVFSLNL